MAFLVADVTGAIAPCAFGLTVGGALGACRLLGLHAQHLRNFAALASCALRCSTMQGLLVYDDGHKHVVRLVDRESRLASADAVHRLQEQHVLA